MIEDKAKTKRCPIFTAAALITMTMKAGSDEGMSPDVGLLMRDSMLCIASDCMMWVATDNEYRPEASCNPHDNPESYPAGYCGLTR